MAEEITDAAQNTEEENPQAQAEDMDLVSGLPDESVASESAADLSDINEKPSENGGAKRGREEGEDDGGEGPTKKPDLERSMEEERLEKLESKEAGEEEEEEEEVRKKETDPAAAGDDDDAANVGPKSFRSSVEMFDYFHRLLHDWPTNLDINKYEHMALADLLKKGHSDAGKKIGEGIQAFQVRYHPAWKSRCFFLLRIDGSVDDFSFRKCVDNILPLPDNMKVPSASSNGKKAWGQHKGGGGGGGHGRGGRGGRGRGNSRGR